MTRNTSTVGATRRGVLKTGALGLGGLSGAVLAGGATAPHAAAATAAAPHTGVAAPMSVTPGKDSSYYLQVRTLSSNPLGLPVVGDSTWRDHPKWVEVADWSFKVTNPFTFGSGSGGSTAGRASFGEVTFDMPAGTASAAIFRNVAATAAVEITLHGVWTSNRFTFVEMVFRPAYFTGWQPMGADMTPNDEVTFVYGALGITRFNPNAGPSAPPPTQTAWSVVTNDPTLPPPQ